MKKVNLLIIFYLMIAALSHGDENAVDFYLKYSRSTDPCRYAYLYETLQQDGDAARKLSSALWSIMALDYVLE